MEHALSEWLSGVHPVILLGLTLTCIAVLCFGADRMIEAVVELARRTGLPRIIIGATIVSLGTTLPEAFVSVMAAWMGNSGLALGNGVGSIIADTGLIMGLGCLLTPVPMNHFILNRTGWVQVGSATLLAGIAVFLLLVSSGQPTLPRSVGLLFLLLLGGYLIMAYQWSKRGGDLLVLGGEEAPAASGLGLPGILLRLLFGLLLVVAGARILIPAASETALRCGVPEDIIAATMIAFGTSLPELVTAISAVRKGHPEIMVGNVVGADVLNCLFVIGAAAAAKPLPIPATFYSFHFPAMLCILYSFRLFVSLSRSGRFNRLQGAWLLTLYGLYLILQYAYELG